MPKTKMEIGIQTVASLTKAISDSVASGKMTQKEADEYLFEVKEEHPELPPDHSLIGCSEWSAHRGTYEEPQNTRSVRNFGESKMKCNKGRGVW